MIIASWTFVALPIAEQCDGLYQICLKSVPLISLSDTSSNYTRNVFNLDLYVTWNILIQNLS